jgi:hypothetical protein
MVIAAAPEALQQDQTSGFASKPAGETENVTRRINLGDAFIAGDEGNLIDLTEEQGEIEFDVTTPFLNILAKGNRILFRLRDPAQLPSIALLAYEQSLQFTFSREGDRINLVLFSQPSVTSQPEETTDLGL